MLLRSVRRAAAARGEMSVLVSPVGIGRSGQMGVAVLQWRRFSSEPSNRGYSDGKVVESKVEVGRKEREGGEGSGSKGEKGERKDEKPVSSEVIPQTAEKSSRVAIPSYLRAEIPKLSELMAQGSALALKGGRFVLFRLPVMVVGWVRTFFHLLLTNPKELKVRARGIWKAIVDEAKHMWLGMRLLFSDVQTSGSLLSRVVQGHSLSRRERRLLVRTTTDIFRLVPFTILMIIPFTEFLLPFILKLVPGMLPSTFKSSVAREEERKKTLQARVEIAKFMQEAAAEMGQKAASRGESGEGAESLLRLLERVRRGEVLGTEDILRTASFFRDEVTMETVGREQLVLFARFFGLNPYVPDALLRFQLRSKINALKEDDAAILWEGIESLSKEELAAACAERGMRSTGLTQEGYRQQLQQWLDLSVNRNVPASLLILSRAFTINAVQSDAARALQKTVSELEEALVSEVVFEASSGDLEEASREETSAQRRLQLLSLEFQNRLVVAEREASEALEKAREASDRARAEGASPEEREAARNAMQQAREAAQRAAAVARKGATAVRQHVESSTPAVEAILSESEADVLRSLIQERNLLQERAALARLKAARMQMEAVDMLQRGRIGGKAQAEQVEEAAEEPGVVGMVRKSLDSMLGKLEIELDKADRTSGDRLTALDKDRDGVVSAEELRSAIKSVLQAEDGRHATDEEAEAIVSKLDADKDGSISLQDIVLFAELRAQQFADKEQGQGKEQHDTSTQSSSSSSSSSSTQSSSTTSSSAPSSSTTSSSAPSSSTTSSTSSSSDPLSSDSEWSEREEDDEDVADREAAQAEAEAALAAIRARREEVDEKGERS